MGTQGDRKRWIVLGIVALLVVARSAIFVFWEQAHFDSNQGVIGLMAKHLIEGRAFPVFMYGQGYMLGVEAWLAAPLFAVTGVSVTALKLPLLGINLVVALLLVWLLAKECRLSWPLAGMASVFFVLPAPGTTGQLLEASGGIVEPLLYVLLLWLTWKRPVWCGLILGFGFLHREFTIYGFAGLLILDGLRGELFTRESLRRLLTVLGSAALVWLVIQGAAQYGSAMGPGTTIDDLRSEPNQIAELAGRVCFEWQALPSGLWKIVTVHWPLLFGTAEYPLRRLEIETDVTQGMPAAIGLLLAGAMLLAIVRIAMHLVRGRWPREYDFCAYLVLVGTMSAAAYVISRCGEIDLYRMRYDMLSIFTAVGVAGGYLAIERSTRIRVVWMLMLSGWVAAIAVTHGRMWHEYVTDPPVGGKQQIARALETQRLRYVYAEYRDAYVVTFLTDERIVVASHRVRIRDYHRQVEAHRGEAVRLQRRKCPGGRVLFGGLFVCPVTPARLLAQR